jgi:hypothetical protein
VLRRILKTMGTTPRQLHAKPDHPDAEDDYEAAAKAVDDKRIDYNQYMPKLRSEHPALKRMAKTLTLVIVIVGCGIGAYVFGTHIATQQTTSHKTKTATTTNTVAPPTKTYTSTYQSLSFVYPSTWQVAETQSTITATSPNVKLTSFNRKTVTGHVIFRIRQPDVSLPEFSAGSATAILSSQIMTYAAPASDQQATAYVSFLNYANSKGTGIDGIYITGNIGYQAGQVAPESDIEQVDPVISFTFTECANSRCTATTPLTIASSSWSDASFSKPLLAIFASLNV